MDTLKPKTTAKDFFLHIGIIVALYVFATSFLAFLFDIINYTFPDRQAYYGDPYSSSMRFALSTLIIFFPVLLILLKVVYKELLAKPEKRDLALRKWLIYLTLFITALTIAIDLVVLLNTFLGGEITARFIWKVVAVLVVAGGIFWTTLSDLKGRFFERPQARTVANTVAAIVVIAAVVWGFVVIGSPSTLRDIRDDNQRVSDLQNIQWQVLNNYQTKGKLPVSLNELSDPISGYVVPTDPVAGSAYEYQIVATSTPTAKSLTFELCATFAQKTQNLEGRGDYPSGIGGIGSGKDIYYDPVFGSSNWNHDVGRTCFTRTIDPEKYPVIKK